MCVLVLAATKEEIIKSLISLLEDEHLQISQIKIDHDIEDLLSKSSCYSARTGHSTITIDIFNRKVHEHFIGKMLD